MGRERPAGLPVGAVLHEGPISGSGFISGHCGGRGGAGHRRGPLPVPARPPGGLDARLGGGAWPASTSARTSRSTSSAASPPAGRSARWCTGSSACPAGNRRSRPRRRAAAPLRARRSATCARPTSRPAARTRSTASTTTVAAVYVKVLDPDRFERDWLYRLYRLLVVPRHQGRRRRGAAGPAGRARGVRRDDRAGTRRPDAAGDPGPRQRPRGAVVVQEYVVGRPLDDLPPDERDPRPAARQVWEQVALLHDAADRPPRPGGLQRAGRRRRAGHGSWTSATRQAPPTPTWPGTSPS